MAEDVVDQTPPQAQIFLRDFRFPPGKDCKLTRILVTDGEQRSSLAVVRSLGGAGHHVAVTAWDRRPLAGASRHCSRSYTVPRAQTDPAGYVAGVVEAARDFGASVLLPMTDVSAPLLLGRREAMPGVTVPFPALDGYTRISDKAHLMEVARGLGVPVPEQVVVPGPGAAAEVLGDHGLGFPVVLKPARSAVTSPSGPIKVGVRMVGNASELRDGLEAYPDAAYPILVQRRIFGPGLGVFLLAWDGRTLAAFAHRRIREKPPSGGVSVYRESVPVRPDLLEHSQRLLEACGWRGVAMVEFKEDQASGVPYLMEVNARFWGSLQLAIDSGVDFPRILLACVEGRVPEPTPAARTGIRSRWLWGDVDHLIALLRMSSAQRQAHPDLPGRLQALGRFMVPWRPGDRFEVLRLRDPGPFLAESVNWFQDALTR